jgi:oligopeptide/dipeptide ABC transporter ATP-binding protein
MSLTTEPMSPPTGAALQVTDLQTTFRSARGDIEALRGVSFSLPVGGTMVLLGESGSGKSVTARSIMRLYSKSAQLSGSVRLGDRELLTLPESQMRLVRGRSIGLVPQDPTGALDPLRSIGSQLVEMLRVSGTVTARREAKQRALDLLALVGIPDPKRVARSRPHQLSGGMRQRAVIAIAVSSEPAVLIADEPTTALDVTVQAQVLELFTDLQRRLGTAMILVTHDVGVAEEIGGTIGVMYAGRLVETGPAAQVLANPHHPYTAGLMASLPTPGIERGKLPVIAGRPPLTGEYQPGCAFAPRCPLVQEACRLSRPSLIPVGRQRLAACPIVPTATESDRPSSTNPAHGKEALV